MKKTTSTYEQQALDFLAVTGTQFSVKFLRHGKHFDDDKETRDIYEITLQRGQRNYTFNFGQSIANSGEWIVKDFNPEFTRVFNSKEDALKFHHKIHSKYGVSKNPNKKDPTAYDVLTCLEKNEVGTFGDFCSEFGYDTDSRKAEKVYHAVKEEYLNISRLFNEQELEQLREIN